MKQLLVAALDALCWMLAALLWIAVLYVPDILDQAR